MLRVKKTFAAVLAAFALFGLARAEEPTNDIQRLTVIGYRLRTGEALGPVVELGKGDIAVTCKPMAGVVYRTPVTADDNQNRFQASIPFGYKAVRWMRRAWNDRGDGEEIPDTEGLSEAVIAWDGRWSQVDLILIIETDPARKVTFGKSTFGEGEIGHELGTFDCEVGDKFTLKAVPAFDDAHHVSLSKFLSWNDGETAPERTVVIDSNETYIARFEPSTWKVAFDAGDGTVEPTEKTVTYGFRYGVLPTPQSNGYVFRGWTWNDGEEDRTITADSVVGPLGDHTLFAQWAAANIRIGCEIGSCDGGNGLVGGVGEYTYGDEVRLEAKPFGGSLFYGWADGETLNPRLTVALSNTTYQALFTSQYYKVQFEYRDAGGNLVHSGVQDVRYGRAATPPDEDLVTNWVGHVFYGWKQDYERITENHLGDRAIQANYEGDIYVVSFDANGGEGEMPDQSFSFDTGKSLLKCQFTWEGKIFLGWSKDKEAKQPTYADQEVVTGLTAERSVVLFAVWTDEPAYTVVFEPNGADNAGAMAAQIMKNGVGGVLAANRYVRDGYDFKGWSTNAVGATADFADKGRIAADRDLAGPGETVHLWAVWEPIKYTLYLDGNGGELVSQQPFDMVYGEEKTLVVGSADREGYEFDSWSTNSLARPGEGEWTEFQPTVSNLTKVAGAKVTLYIIWVKDPYTVKFNGNGADGTMQPQKMSSDVEQALASNAFTKVGYVFKGWSEKPDGEVKYGDGEAVLNLADVGGSIELFAVWAPIAYQVGFDGNGATSGEMPDVTLTYDKDEDLPPNAFERIGHTFTGWERDGVKVPSVHMPNLTTVDGDRVVLTAAWKANTYQVVFDGNGATPDATYDQSFTYGEAQALTSNAFEKTGHTFAGWTNATAAATYVDGEVVSNLTAEADGEVTLTAMWTANAYQVVFDGNGATSGSVPAMDFTYGVAQELPTNGFAKTGHTLAGWEWNGTLITGSVSNLTEEAGATVTVKACWTPNAYTVIFDKNADDAVGEEIKPVEATYGVPFALPDGGFTRAHYKTDGWATAADAEERSYANGEVVSNLTANADGEVTLYVFWSKTDTYAVEFKANGGTGDMHVQYFENGVNGNLNSNTFVRTGYTFAGWATNATAAATFADGQKIETDLAAKDETNTLYATWSPIAYTVIFEGGEGKMDPQPFIYDEAQTLTSNAFEKAGHTFAGWANAIAAATYADGEVVSNLTAEADGEVTLTALWTANAYQVAFDGNGADSGSVPAMDFTYGVAQALPANGFEKTGHTFAGWEWNGTLITGSVSNLTEEAGATVTVKAHWTPNAYTVIFDKNADDAVGEEIKPVEATYGVPFALPDGGYTRAHYKPDGWATAAEARERSYANGEVVSNLTAEAKGEVTLYVFWSDADTYAVEFKANGGTGDMPVQYFENGVNGNLNSNTFVRTGYTFAGWATNATAAATFADGQKIETDLAAKDETNTLYATWSPNSYTVVFEGGEGKMDPQSFTYDEAKALTSNAFEKTGHTFAGWTNAIAAATYVDGEVVSNLTEKSDGEVTLTAIWSVNKELHKLKFDANGGSGGQTVDRTYGEEIPEDKANVNAGTKEGYTLSGWKTNGVQVVFPFIMPGEDVTMVAQWQPIKYTISFNGNGAQGEMKPMILQYDQETNLTCNAFELTGYAFMGWTNATGWVFANEQTISKLTTKAGEQITLFARWDPKGSTPFSQALGTTLSVKVSPEGAWEADLTNSKVVRRDTSPEGTLQVEIPGPGTLVFIIKRDYNGNFPLKTNFKGTENEYPGNSGGYFQTITQDFGESGILEFSGTPDEDETFELSKFTWTAN